jgi:hypothetical protein
MRRALVKVALTDAASLGDAPAAQQTRAPVEQVQRREHRRAVRRRRQPRLV